MKHHRSAGQAVLESAAIVKALHAGDRLADGVGIMPVRLIAVAAEEGFDAFRPAGRLRQPDPVRALLLRHNG
jgi:hypothetical protein